MHKAIEVDGNVAWIDIMCWFLHRCRSKSNFGASTKNLDYVPRLIFAWIFRSIPVYPSNSRNYRGNLNLGQGNINT
jgi:hypothetical protein